MEIKHNIELLQSEAKHLQKMKKSYETMLDNYENKIFPSTIEKYYENKLSSIYIQTIGNIYKKEKNKTYLYKNSKIELNKDLFSIEKSKLLLGNYYQAITDFFISLKKDEKLILYILKNINGEEQNILINYISFLFFENVFDFENISSSPSSGNNSNEIFLNRILEVLIESELEEINNKGRNYSNFLDSTLASKLIKNLMKREDVQKYIRDIFIDIITDITEMENKNVFMEPNRIRDYLNPKVLVKEKKKGKSKDHKFLKKIKNLRYSLIKKNSKESINKDNSLVNNSLNIPITKSVNYAYNLNLDITNNDNNMSLNEFNNISTIAHLSFSTEENISNFLYQGLTHSRLLYNINDQKILFNECDKYNNCYSYYKPMNLDKYLEIKERNPEPNNDYSKYDLSQKELNYRYKESGKTNKYMELFYYTQLLELQKDPDKKFSNNDFIKLLKNSYSQYLENLIPQYKKNFEKIKYFIDKMIYKMLENKEDKIPFCIKNIVNVIRNYLIKKQQLNQIEINRYIFEFFIGKIIIPFLINEEFINLIIGKKIDLESKNFLFYLAKIIKKIFRSNFFDSFEQHFTIFNIYLIEILPYINLIINLIPSNIEENISTNDNVNTINNDNNKNTNITNINKYDTLIINDKIMNIIIEFLIKNNNSGNNSIIDNLMSKSPDLQLKEYFKIISDNYNDIIQQVSQNNEVLNKDNIQSAYIDNNIFGGPFYILTKDDIKKQILDQITLDSNKIQNITKEILPKIKYCLINILELIPSNIFIKNPKLIKYKNIIDIFGEMKTIIGKEYICDSINDNNDKNEKEELISFIWYLDYFINSYNYLNDEYKNNNFEKLFSEIKQDIEKDLLLYKKDLSEYNFGVIIDNANDKIISMNNLFNFYNQNSFLYKIYNYIFNNLKIKVDIYEYEYTKDEKKLLYFNKLSNKDNKDNKELNFIQNITIENIPQLIKYISDHIIQEDILNNFIYIENNSKTNFSQINNINTFMEEYIDILKEYIIGNNFTDNNSINNNNDINSNNINNIIIEESDKEKIDEIINLVEEIIHEEIYKKIWNKSQSNEDVEINELCEYKLNKITPADLGIKDKYINKDIYENIIYLMKTKYNINNYKTPMKKLKCVEDIYKILNKSITVITNKTSRYSVDDIFPIFAYLLIKIKPENLYSNLNYIKLFFRKKNLIKSSGFSLTQLEMAIQYIKNIEINDNNNN